MSESKFHTPQQKLARLKAHRNSLKRKNPENLAEQSKNAKFDDLAIEMNPNDARRNTEYCTKKIALNNKFNLKIYSNETIKPPKNVVITPSLQSSSNQRQLHITAPEIAKKGIMKENTKLENANKVNGGKVNNNMPLSLLEMLHTKKDSPNRQDDIHVTTSMISYINKNLTKISMKPVSRSIISPSQTKYSDDKRLANVILGLRLDPTKPQTSKSIPNFNCHKDEGVKKDTAILPTIICSPNSILNSLKKDSVNGTESSINQIPVKYPVVCPSNSCSDSKNTILVSANKVLEKNTTTTPKQNILFGELAIISDSNTLHPLNNQLVMVIKTSPSISHTSGMTFGTQTIPENVSANTKLTSTSTGVIPITKSSSLAARFQPKEYSIPQDLTSPVHVRAAPYVSTQSLTSDEFTSPPKVSLQADQMNKETISASKSYSLVKPFEGISLHKNENDSIEVKIPPFTCKNVTSALTTSTTSFGSLFKTLLTSTQSLIPGEISFPKEIGINTMDNLTPVSTTDVILTNSTSIIKEKISDITSCSQDVDGGSIDIRKIGSLTTAMESQPKVTTGLLSMDYAVIQSSDRSYFTTASCTTTPLTQEDIPEIITSADISHPTKLQSSSFTNHINTTNVLHATTGQKSFGLETTTSTTIYSTTSTTLSIAFPSFSHQSIQTNTVTLSLSNSPKGKKKFKKSKKNKIAQQERRPPVTCEGNKEIISLYSFKDPVQVSPGILLLSKPRPTDLEIVPDRGCPQDWQKYADAFPGSKSIVFQNSDENIYPNIMECVSLAVEKNISSPQRIERKESDPSGFIRKIVDSKRENAAVLSEHNYVIQGSVVLNKKNVNSTNSTIMISEGKVKSKSKLIDSTRNEPIEMSRDNSVNVDNVLNVLEPGYIKKTMYSLKQLQNLLKVEQTKQKSHIDCLLREHLNVLKKNVRVLSPAEKLLKKFSLINPVDEPVQKLPVTKKVVTEMFRKKSFQEIVEEQRKKKEKNTERSSATQKKAKMIYSPKQFKKEVKTFSTPKDTGRKSNNLLAFSHAVTRSGRILSRPCKDPDDDAEKRAVNRAIALSLNSERKRKITNVNATPVLGRSDVQNTKQVAKVKPKKRRQNELDLLTDTHWNESWMKESSPSESVCSPNSIREQRSLDWVMSKFAEMEQTVDRKLDKATKLKTSPPKHPLTLKKKISRKGKSQSAALKTKRLLKKAKSLKAKNRPVVLTEQNNVSTPKLILNKLTHTEISKRKQVARTKEIACLLSENCSNANGNFSSVFKDDRTNKAIKKVYLNVNRSTGEKVLQKASRMGYVNLVSESIRNGADVNGTDHAGWTALHEASAYSRLEVARILVRKGADPNCSSNSGIRPIHDAIEKGDLPMIRLLLSYGAKFALDVKLNEPVYTFLKDVGDDRQIDVDIHSKDFREKTWRFSGSCQLLDTNDCSGIFSDLPPEERSSESIEFTLCCKPMLQSYYLPIKSESNTIIGYRNYYLLKDVVEKLNTTETLFSKQHRKFEMRKMQAEDLKRAVKKYSCSQLSQLDLFQPNEVVTLVNLSVYTLKKLFTERSVNVKIE